MDHPPAPCRGTVTTPDSSRSAQTCWRWSRSCPTKPACLPTRHTTRLREITELRVLLAHGVILPETPGNERPWFLLSGTKHLPVGLQVMETPRAKIGPNFQDFFIRATSKKPRLCFFLGAERKDKRRRGLRATRTQTVTISLYQELCRWDKT